MNFRFSSYWGNWSRVLKLPSDSDPTYIEVDLTPIYGHNWERVREVRIRRHLTAPDPKDTLSQTLPSEVREEMVEALGGRLTDFILKEDLLSSINWKKYEKFNSGGASWRFIASATAVAAHFEPCARCGEEMDASIHGSVEACASSPHLKCCEPQSHHRFTFCVPH